MENDNENNFFERSYFKTSFNKEDVTNLPLFKKWKLIKEKENKKIVRCPHCWGYEIFVIPTNYRCSMCDKLYCQKCLKPCVENEVLHDHERGCWSKFKGLIDIMKDWGYRGAYINKIQNKDLIKACLVFIFGNHILYTIKYYKFFQSNKIIENDCVHSFFKYINLFVNIIYCVVYNIMFFEFFFLIFLPAFFINCYYRFIAYNWLIVLEFEVDESPITELTVRGRGYDMY
jgi:hypothetical protein